MAYEVIMPYHLHMPSYFLETFTEYPYKERECIKMKHFIAFDTLSKCNINYVLKYRYFLLSLLSSGCRVYPYRIR